jgi:hypothetical protein
MLKKITQCKKSQNMLTGAIGFIIINILIFVILLLFIARFGTTDAAIEKAYSRQIALAVDDMISGTEISIYLPDLFDAAAKNKYSGEIVIPDYNENKITVKVSYGEGNSYYYFTKLPSGSISIDRNNKKVIVKT